MTTTRSTTKIAPTLAQFSAALDLAAGRRAGFTEAVTTLAAVRARKAVVSARRAVVFDAIKEHHARGNLVVGGGVVLKTTRPHPGRLVRAVPAAAAKKADARAWAAARRPKPHVQAKPSVAQAAVISADAEAAVGALPPVPHASTTLAQLAQWYRDLSTKDLANEETAAVTALRVVGEATGWDGLPVEFADGWKTSLYQLTYDSDALREVAPELWESLAVERTVGASDGHVYLGRLGEDDEPDADDGE